MNEWMLGRTILLKDSHLRLYSTTEHKYPMLINNLNTTFPCMKR